VHTCIVHRKIDVVNVVYRGEQIEKRQRSAAERALIGVGGNVDDRRGLTSEIIRGQE
jgi:hypothetical protein